MTLEYLVLGIVLILMGAVQIWLRHGPGSKELGGAAGGEDETDLGGARRPAPVSSGRRIRSGRVWEGWTAILGFVGVAIGIALVIMGTLGK